MKPAAFDHLSPESPAAAAAMLSEGTRILAGGQSLGPMLNLRLARPERLAGLSALAQLRDIREERGRIILGAGVTHARIEDGDSPVALPPMLRHVARGIAYRAVRNRGTVGGSLAHADPAADWVTALTAMGAEVVLLSGSGAERRVALPGFVRGAYRTALGPQEIISAVEIPAAMRDALWGYHKLCRKVGEFADAIGAIAVHPASGHLRLVAGATGGAPLVLSGLGDGIARSGAHPGPAALRSALAAALPGADRVKLQLLATALDRAIAKVIPA
ncbi:xanthine dehydrogenase family protein subunit M [Poseidonocella sp. HB161398]|uniref:FAD binding domain-containing protein n=1 Tax=Poseidonocella sp. HB161398 TaxID=2320855 RepID=UPI00110837E1|nr:FAD binding domain-containing protein [Poseidonocella sp. HB161398]